MKLTTHLAFDGQCRPAFETYQRILGGTRASHSIAVDAQALSG